MVIDTDKSALENLTEEFSGFAIIGDAAEIKILQEAKLEPGDCAIAQMVSQLDY